MFHVELFAMVVKMGMCENQGMSYFVLSFLFMLPLDARFLTLLTVFALSWFHNCVIIYVQVYVHDLDVASELVLFLAF